MAELTLAATTENLARVNAFVRGLLEPYGCPARTLLGVELAVEECYVNVAHYAYAPGTGAVTVCCEVGEEPPRMTLVLKDRGVPFNPLGHGEPDLRAGLEERPVGGLGIFLARRYMDTVEYRYAAGQNILTMTKAIA